MQTNDTKQLLDVLPEFRIYMTTVGSLQQKTGDDYISRLKFLLYRHQIDFSLDKSKVEAILAIEESERDKREIYKTKDSIRDFRAGLNKFLQFIESDYEKIYENNLTEQIEAVKNSQDLSPTEKEAIIKSRVGQSVFREGLLRHWDGCAISKCKMKDILIASHIKPWRMADNYERLDSYNGLLLLPNYDKLFDKGFITIDCNGRVLLSKLISDKDKQLLNVVNLPAVQIEKKHIQYLNFHKKFIFRGALMKNFIVGVIKS